MFDWVIWASENIEIFKLKLSWSKSARLLQSVAFLVKILIFTCLLHERVIYKYSWKVNE